MAGLRELNAHWTWMMRRMLRKLVIICPLTHERNILDANECIKNNPSGDFAIVDGIATADGLGSVIRPPDQAPSSTRLGPVPSELQE